MVSMSIITVGIVFYTHSRRTEPYLESKRLKLEYSRPAVAPAVAKPTEAHVADAAPGVDAGIDSGTLATPP